MFPPKNGKYKPKPQPKPDEEFVEVDLDDIKDAIIDCSEVIKEFDLNLNTNIQSLIDVAKDLVVAVENLKEIAMSQPEKEPKKIPLIEVGGEDNGQSEES